MSEWVSEWVSESVSQSVTKQVIIIIIIIIIITSTLPLRAVYEELTEKFTLIYFYWLQTHIVFWRVLQKTNCPQESRVHCNKLSIRLPLNVRHWYKSKDSLLCQEQPITRPIPCCVRNNPSLDHNLQQIHTTKPQLISFKSILISSPHLFLVFPSDFLPAGTLI